MKSLHSSLLLPLLFALFITSSCQDPPTQKPNIIIVYADDLGYGDISSQNPAGKISTPNIDQLAVEGMRFTDAHSSSGICTPSRYALLTGRYHWRDFHGIVGPMGPPAFKESQFTMAKMLQDEGYRTGCVGKWHLGWDWEAIRDPNWTKQDSMEQWNRTVYFYPPEAYDWSKSVPGGPLDRGFEYYYGDGTINFPPYAFMENDKVVGVPDTTMLVPEGEPLEGNWEVRPGPAMKNWNFYDVLPTITKKAVDFVKAQQDQEEPFFLYVPFSAPHAPIIPNEEFVGTSEAGPFGDFVQQTDWSIGQILNALDEIGERENTLVIFSADNGPERYAYDRIRNFDHHSSAPFRGLKRDIYEGGHHVPFVIRWPGHISDNSVCDQVISQVDILQTLASIVGTELPLGLAHDSHDFAAVWLGDDPSQVPVRSATVHNTFKDRYALRQGDWVYLNHKSGYHSKTPDWVAAHFGYSEIKSETQLFNLSDDIGQRTNLADSMPEIVAEMRERLALIRDGETFVE